MSSSGGPRKPKPTRRPSADLPPTEPDTGVEGSNVFRPNPRAGEDGRRASKPRSRPRDTGAAPGWGERILYGSVGSGQLAVFCRQFAAYANAGVDYHRALVSLQEQFSSTALGPVCGRLAAAVKRGETLTAAMEREPRTFDRLFLSMLRVAEARGGVPETLRMLAQHYDARQRLIRQARSAMIYPIVVLVLAGGVIGLLTVWLLPMLADMLIDISGRGAELPLPSRMLMAFSRFVRSIGWLVIPVVVIGTPIVLYQVYRTTAGKRVLDRLVLWVPVFGPILKKLDTSRFARALASLTDAGVDVRSSLELTAEVVRLEPFRSAILETKTQVMRGSDLSSALLATHRFSPDVIAVVNSGEETGKLPESLTHLADDYEEQVEHIVKNLGQLIQPVLYIMLGGIVLFIILAVFLPYLSILTNLARP